MKSAKRFLRESREPASPRFQGNLSEVDVWAGDEARIHGIFLLESHPRRTPLPGRKKVWWKIGVLRRKKVSPSDTRALEMSQEKISRDFPTAVCGVTAAHAARISSDSSKVSLIRSTVETADGLPPTTAPPLPRFVSKSNFTSRRE